jgi:hypothetical protein
MQTNPEKQVISHQLPVISKTKTARKDRQMLLLITDNCSLIADLLTDHWQLITGN